MVLLDLVQAVGAEGHKVSVPVKDKAAGTTLRGLFYGLRYALRTTEPDSERRQFAESMRATIVSYKEVSGLQPWFVLFVPIDTGAETDSIATAIAKARGQ